jgi:enoyl-CoA hydratase/carnithine racemase
MSVDAQETPADTTGEPEREEVLYDVVDHVATLTLNAPERMNTISGPMLAAISARLLEADADPAARCIVITGAGRAFCAGLDLQAQMAGPKGGLGNLGDGSSFNGELDLRNTPPTVLHDLDTPTICALNGGAAGYGLDLALGCDIRIAADTAKLNPGFAKRGILPESGGTWLLPRIVGYARAAEIAFT